MMQYLVWLLCAFFLIGTLTNGLAPGNIREDYARWGYPKGFNYVTSALEFATALLLFFPDTRALGAGLGMMIMAAAAVTLLRDGQRGHAIAPVVVFGLAALVLWGGVPAA